MKHCNALLLIIFAIIGACLGQNFYPSSVVCTSGSDSSSDGDVSISALATQDESGSDDKWKKYIEFYGTADLYQGTFSFPVTVSCADSFSLNMNYRGPTSDEQVWVLEWYVPSTNSYVLAANNTGAKSWAWTKLSFDQTVAFNTLVNDNDIVQLRLSSLSIADACDLDFLQLSVFASSESSSSEQQGGGGGVGPQPTAAPATAAPTSAPATAKPTSQPTSKPPTSAPATSKPTSAPATHAPTSAPATHAPTSAPATQKPTSAPATSKPTSAPATQKPTSAPSSSSSSGSSSSGGTFGPSVAPTNGGRFCPNGTHYRPGPYTTWQWQLTGNVDTTVDVQVYDIDMFNADASLIAELHSKGRAVVCYIDTAFEPGRPDSADFTAAVKGAAMKGWPGQYWVDIRSDVVRNIMVNRIALAASKQCDAVEMDDVDSYENKPGFPITAADQADFNTFLATTAHAAHMGIALKNDIDQVAQLAPVFDFAINEQCFQYNECSDLNNFIQQGKAVFGVEYSLATSKFCDNANADEFSWMKKDLDLDASRTQCCTTNCGGPWYCIAD